ncbi:MAG: FlgO family outer membrane protein, partial [Vicinamibacterales bacterium]|nr:FlgO family outer membrane protein [Vicinamibacterales bacterium]
MMLRWHGVVASGCCLVLAASPAVGEVSSVHRLGTAPYAQSAAVAPEPANVVAVVPFSNITRVSSDDWIGDGIAETVRAELQALGLPVLERVLVGADAGDTADGGSAVRLGRQLGASWVVSGAYQRLGDYLRITARVVDATSGVVLRAAKADGTLDDIFALQDRIVAALFADLDLTGSAPPTPPATGASVQFPPAGEFTAGGADAPSRVVPGEPAPGGRGGRGGFGIATGRPSVSATRTSSPPRVDGRLDDAVWQEATRITEFVQQQPLDGAPATEETEVFVANDANNLYFGIYAHYSDPVLIRANLSDRDRTFNDDTISVYFDPFLDQQRAYVFSVNGYGVQGDSLLDSRGGSFGGSGGGGGGGPGGGVGSIAGGFGAAMAMATGGFPRGDPTWDALYESGGMLVEDGWTAELAIPFKSLRYPTRRAGEDHLWGFQIVRTIPSKDETDVWAPVSRDVAGFLTQMGLLDNLTNLSTSRNLEILPTFTAIQFGALDAGTGSFDEETQPEGSLNVKYGVTPNLTFDFTYNPDFSQIESDTPQIEINQRFPLFFPELRPFFLEGQEIFRVPGQTNLVHTRTMVDPRYGAKLTGKLGNTTVGVLVSDDEAPGRRDDPTDPAFGETAKVVVGRARYDLYAESYIGVIATDREFLGGYSRVGGVDGRFRLGRTSSVSFQYAASQHRDETGAERSGPIFHVNYNRRGRNLSYSASVDTVDPEFRTDTGFVRRVDTRVARANVSYRWWPNNLMINWGPQVSYSRNYDFAGTLQDEQTSVSLFTAFKNGIILTGNINRDMERFLGTEFFKTTYFVGGGVNASRKVSIGGMLNWGDQVFFTETPFLGRSVGATIFTTLRPVSRLNAELLAMTSRLRDPLTNDQLFDVKIGRTVTTYQFTGRLLFRNIMEYNTFSKHLSANFLVTYRINAGTV